MVRSFKADRSTTERSERPIKRWISCVLPDDFPREDSLIILVLVDLGIIPYSEVTQPCPVPRKKEGTFSSTLAVQITRVSPHSMSAEPSACLLQLGVIVTGLRSPTCLPSLRFDIGDIVHEGFDDGNVTCQAMTFTSVNQKFYAPHLGEILRK